MHRFHGGCSTQTQIPARLGADLRQHRLANLVVREAPLIAVAFEDGGIAAGHQQGIEIDLRNSGAQHVDIDFASDDGCAESRCVPTPAGGRDDDGHSPSCRRRRHARAASPARRDPAARKPPPARARPLPGRRRCLRFRAPGRRRWPDCCRALFPAWKRRCRESRARRSASCATRAFPDTRWPVADARRRETKR